MAADVASMGATHQVQHKDATLIYTCKFNQKKPNLISAGGSGGCAFKIIDWERSEIVAETVVNGSIFDCCVSKDGRYGAFTGDGFGI